MQEKHKLEIQLDEANKKIKKVGASAGQPEGAARGAGEVSGKA